MVSSFIYLGVVISVKILEYSKFKVEPLLVRLRSGLKIWCNLPLSVVDRANLVWLPQLFYVLHNSPIWFTQTWFRRIDSLVRGLIWKKKYARIILTTFQRANLEGGLVIPHAKMYFLEVCVTESPYHIPYNP